MLQKTFFITSEEGLDARAAFLLEKKANAFVSEISLGYKEYKVNVKSILGPMSLGIRKNSEVTVFVNGSDEQEALSGIEDSFKELSLVE
ncbi:HPr family phosphocarrier protein [Bacillus sp. EB600]|uniref:HPr family phosphocarrier protein n=1 Tax=Bacillus sp. EB600 TaxID=2806345 RepID=UPI00210879DE|nr:HPr family phosphocarrier protein [Bacillus sp. EB600]MCQ6282167.1 HPr family phosphocarrier protein [Bacillus sp. EB600]